MDGYAVAKYVERHICGATSSDGDAVTARIYQVDHRQCIISDVSIWTENMEDCVRNRFPTCQITIQSATSSLTGFVIMIVMDRPRAARMGTAMLFACTILLLYAVTVLLLKSA
jgi:hypothetical protein